MSENSNSPVEDNPEPPARQEDDIQGNPVTEKQQATKRESDRRQLFRGVVECAIALLLLFYIAFMWQIFYLREDDWHISLMLVIPPTTILLVLITSLKYKDNKTEDISALFPQIKQLLETIKDILFK